MAKIIFQKLPIVFCALSGSLSWAQSSHHAGNSLGLGLAKSKFSDEMITGGASANTWSNLGSVRWDHLQPLNDNWLIGVVADFNLAKQKSERVGQSTNDNGYIYTPGNVTTELKRKLALHAQLGFALDETQMIVGRLGFHRSSASVNANSEGSLCFYADYCQPWTSPDTQAVSGQSHVQGHSFALAYRRNLSNKFYMQMEVQKVFYRKNDTLNIQPNVTDLGISLGYRF